MKWLLLGVAAVALVALLIVCWACDRVTEHVMRLDELIDGPRCDHCAPPVGSLVEAPRRHDPRGTSTSPLWVVGGWGANQ